MKKILAALTFILVCAVPALAQATVPVEAAGTLPVAVMAVGSAVAPAAHAAAGHAAVDFPAWSATFFVLLLLSIAVGPLVCPAWWGRNYWLVSFGFALPAAAFVISKDAVLLWHALHEYASFIILIGSLFVVSGGLVIRIGDPGTPLVNSLILLIGAVLANLIGTTGASMILIRPLIRANAWRRRNVHVFVFFIFIVSNCGGLLTPLGDPPLFLGFLRGVPFFWTFGLIPEWAFVCGILLALFALVDRRFFRGEDPVAYERAAAAMPEGLLSAAGLVNIPFLALIVAAFFVPASVQAAFPVAREAVMIAAALLSLAFTPGAIHAENGFTWHPIREVALLFVGIFATMVPVLEMLKLHGAAFGLAEPWHFYWATGSLSSFLDNAPTYLVFFTTAASVAAAKAIAGPMICDVPVLYLKAISCGAVMMGANTYIGNGPNFMVKSICEERGIAMPSFFGYMLWSGLILLPVFGLVTLMFFK